MNPKFISRKTVIRTPVRNNLTRNTPNLVNANTIDSTSKSSSIKDVIRKPVSTDEYNKILIKNQRLAKDNASLKSQSANDKESLRLARNKTIELEQKLCAANNLIEKLKKELKNRTTLEISDQIKAVVSLLMEDYLAIDTIKQEINKLGVRSQSVRGIMSSLQTLIDSNNQSIENLNSDQNSERIDSFLSINSSLRYSLSSQERDLKRRLSTERIRRDFLILNEMSTIFEMSTEHRMSSLASDERNNGSNNINETVNNTHKELTFIPNMVPTDDNLAKESTNASNVITSKTTVHKELAFNQNFVSTASHSMSSVPTSSIGNQKEVKTTKTKRKTKKEINTETNTKKKPKLETKPKKKNQKTLKTQINFGTKNNDSIVYDFTEDEENKENIMPPKLAIRYSQRVRNKRFPLE